MSMFIVPITQMNPLEPMMLERAQAQAGAGTELPFADVLRGAIEETQAAKEVSSKDSYDLAMGNTDNLPQIMINSARYNTALEMTGQLVSRVVSTYNQIMQMQV